MKKYFPALDGLRLLASLNIVLLHLDSSWLLSYMRSWDFIYPAIKAPLFCSSLFFILSGFIYAAHFSDSARIPSLKNFLFKRVQKLYPLHVICTLLMLGLVAYQRGWQDHIAALLKAAAMHLSLLWAFFPLEFHSLNQPSWALSAFFICYTFTPSAARFLNRIQTSRTLWILLLLTLLPGLLWGSLFASAPFTESRYLAFHVFPPMRIFEFLAGMVLAHLYLRGAIRIPVRGWHSDLGIVITLLLLYGNLFLHATPWNALNWISHHSFNLLLYGVLILLLTHSGSYGARFLSWSPIRAVGKASFYPYLWHMPLIALSYWLCGILGCKAWTFNHWTGTLILLALLYGGSTWFMWRENRR